MRMSRSARLFVMGTVGLTRKRNTSSLLYHEARNEIMPGPSRLSPSLLWAFLRRRAGERWLGIVID